MAIVTTIRTFGKQKEIICDGKCKQAWGISSRPQKQLSDNEDDIYWLGDDELEEDAPNDPGTYEGGHAKPIVHNTAHNKWCYRECERCDYLDINPKLDFNYLKNGWYNMPHLESNQKVDKLDDDSL